MQLAVRTATRVRLRVAARPIEAFGLYHVLPGTRALVAWDAPPERGARGVAPLRWPEDALLELAAAGGCETIAVEAGREALRAPWLARALTAARRERFTTALRLAAADGREAGDAVLEQVDAVRIDVDALEQADLALESGRRLRDAGAWVEFSTRIAADERDPRRTLALLARSLARFDRRAPWHVRERAPAHDPCAPRSGRVAAVGLEAGRDAGLEFVYAADAAAGDGELTFCPECRATLLVERFGGLAHVRLVLAGRCPGCDARPPGRFEPRTGR